VEGDEYDSAFFAKVPKFSFYTPDTVIVNAIEYDHADIYANVEAIEAEFKKLVTGLKKTGTAVCCIDFPRVKRLVAEWKATAQCEILTFGADPEADFTIVNREVVGMGQRVTVTGPGLGGCTVEIPMLGEYNARNALAAIIVSQIIGMELGKTTEYLAAFRSVKRRQEVRAQRNGVVLIEDFAHHPTAVEQTVDAIREAFPSARLWAVFEPRSNTSRRKIFEQAYVQAFRRADHVIIKNVQARAIDSGVELIDVQTLSKEITASGIPSVCLDTVEEIRQTIWRAVPRDRKGGSVEDVVFVMSNGSFGGLSEILERDIKEG
jgi:UDP-N-acetylmuramate: L-alanyl-gamma-D-glutamyl-meso-diaminopimelate ligase